MNFTKFLRTHFLTEHLRWLLLNLKGFDSVSMEAEPGGVSLARGQVNRLGVGGNYVCCLVIVVIFIGLRASKMKVIVWREAEGKPQSQRKGKDGRGSTFYGRVDPSSILSELPTYFSFF